MATLFTKIFNKEIPGTVVYEDELCGVLVDIQPEAPKHLLVVPKKEIPSLRGATLEDKSTLGHLLLTAAEVARRQGFAESGYRVVINAGPDGGETISHLHVHLLGGRQMTWPPG